ncbi:MAG: hypothetical protein OXU78_04115 [Deltaproteobacteria bacterium]|nr:hypothetical protein [Deltaproteobacteria bacterium]
MERTQKTWLLEIILAVILAALVGIAGWTANKVVENGERIVEVKAELQKEIAENGKSIVELNGKIAALDAKMDLLISGLNISVTPKESASAETSGAESGGFQVGAGGTATE